MIARLVRSAVVALSLAGLAACPLAEERCEAAGLAPFDVGTVPNDVALAWCGDTQVALVPSSGDGRLDTFALPCGALHTSVAFPPSGGVGAAPWAVAISGERALVTLYGHGAVALVDFCAGTLVDTVGVEAALPLDPPLALSPAIDVDGDGVFDSTVSALRPRTPQAVITRDDIAFVTFTNVLAPGLDAQRPPVLAPGALARVRVGDTLAIDAVTALPCENPQGLARGPGVDAPLWVSCSGPLGPDGERAAAALGDGALLRADPDSLDVTATVDVGRFAPGTPAVFEDGETLIVGSLVDPALARVAGGVLEARAVAGGAVESIFECLPLATRAACTHFSGDRLLLVDPGTDPGAPWGVAAELAVGPGGAAFRGAQALALAPTGPRAPAAGAAVLLGLSAELAPLDPGSLAAALDEQLPAEAP